MKKDNKKIIALALLTVFGSTLSLPANADIEWFANENGGTENCIARVRIKSTSTLGTPWGDGPLLDISDEWETTPGTQGGCDDASIWYACRTKCTPNNDD